MYMLDADHNIIPTESIKEWGEWFETADRIVGRDRLFGTTVSTVFVGLDQAYPRNEESPTCFETMVWGPDGSENVYRCKTWTEAIEQHKKAVKEAETKT